MALRELWRESFDVEEVTTKYPPRWFHSHKQRIWDLVMEHGPGSGKVEVCRWGLKRGVTGPDVRVPTIRIVPAFFDYAPESGAVWWMNFADPRLFAFYGTSLLAQDELQVLEHPVLASIREAIVASVAPCETMNGLEPTPVTVFGAPRRVRLETQGLYGNRFAAASIQRVMAAVEILDPPTVSNIVAMAAPEPGEGVYTRTQLERIWTTAVAGFLAVRKESAQRGLERPTRIHTGFWGCGAFGGHRELMSLLQMAAAGAVKIDEIVFHTGSAFEAGPIETAEKRLREMVGEEGVCEAGEFMDRVEAIGYEWGASDGN